MGNIVIKSVINKLQFIFLLGVCSFAHNGKAEEVVIALGNFAPLFSTSDQPALFKDLIDGVYRYIPQKKVAYRYMVPNSRLVVELNSNAVDGAANIFSQHEIKGCLTNPVFAYSDVAISKKSQQIAVKNIEDLAKFKVVSYQRATTLLGTRYKDAVTKNKHYTEVAQPEDQAKLLSSGLVDVSIGDKYIFLHSLQQWSKGTQSANDYVIHPIFPAVASSIGFNDQQHCDEFNHALAQFKESGEYQAVYDKHLKRLGYHH